MKKTVCLLLCIVLLLSGCAGGETVRTAEIIEVNTAQDSPTYVEGEDCQQQWNSWSTTIGKMAALGIGGYYYCDDNAGMNMLWFHDDATGQTVPVCNRPDCDHTDDCSARLNFGSSYLHWYDGNLYSIYTDLFNVNLQRISPDGATRDDIGTLFTMGEMGGSVMAVFHRGYVYCIPTGGGLEWNKTKMYRMSLGGGEEAELIHTFDPVIGGEAFLRAYGNYVYILHQHYADKDANGYSGDLWRYHIHTGEMELMMEGMRRMFALDEQYLYYDSDTQVIARNLETGEETVLLELGVPVCLLHDGKYLYCDNHMGLNVTDAPEDARRFITIIDTETMEVVGSVDWERHTQYCLIGVAEGVLLGKQHWTEDGSFYTCDLETILSGGEGVWDIIG